MENIEMTVEQKLSFLQAALQNTMMNVAHLRDALFVSELKVSFLIHVVEKTNTTLDFNKEWDSYYADYMAKVEKFEKEKAAAKPDIELN